MVLNKAAHIHHIPFRLRDSDIKGIYVCMCRETSRIWALMWKSHINIKYLVLTEMKVVWMFHEKYKTNTNEFIAAKKNTHTKRNTERTSSAKMMAAQKHVIKIRRQNQTNWKKAPFSCIQNANSVQINEAFINFCLVYSLVNVDLWVLSLS